RLADEAAALVRDGRCPICRSGLVCVGGGQFPRPSRGLYAAYRSARSHLAELLADLFDSRSTLWLSRSNRLFAAFYSRSAPPTSRRAADLFRWRIVIHRRWTTRNQRTGRAQLSFAAPI